MRCPECDSNITHVIDSRNFNDKHYIRRRRECDECNHRFTSYEIVITPEEFNLLVLNTDPNKNKELLDISEAINDLKIKIDRFKARKL